MIPLLYFYYYFIDILYKYFFMIPFIVYQFINSNGDLHSKLLYLNIYAIETQKLFFLILRKNYTRIFSWCPKYQTNIKFLKT